MFRPAVNAAKRRAGPLQSAVHRLHARVKQQRDLSPAEGQHIPEEQNRSLARRQNLEDSEKCERDRLVRVVPRLRSDLRRGNAREEVVWTGPWFDSIAL